MTRSPESLNASLKSIPSVEKLVSHSDLKEWESKIPRSVRVALVQTVLADYRASLQNGAEPLSESVLLTRLREGFTQFVAPGLRRVINGTGVILHTNLGRAPLGRAALEAMAESLWGYCSLELDLEAGERGDRTERLEHWIRELVGAEAAVVVNNNAAAVWLALFALARGKEVVISRGELVQIGGGFRMPDVLEAAGCRLREVGTTNMTGLSDYRQAIGEETGLLLKVHQSNFVLEGHTQATSLAELIALGGEKELPVLFDLGSGALGRSEPYSVNDAVRAKVDAVCFSGDKLLGGTQAGIIVGKSEAIRRIKKSPLYRALRLGKTELFLLEHCLKQHLSGIPSPTEELRNLSAATLQARAERLQAALDFLPGARVVAGESSIGGGALPGEKLPTFLLEIPVENPERWHRALLAGERPVICRRAGAGLAIDLRTVFPAEEGELVAELKRVNVCLS